MRLSFWRLEAFLRASQAHALKETAWNMRSFVTLLHLWSILASSREVLAVGI